MQAGAPYATDGRLRALAITGPKRSVMLPNVPTMDEAGYGRASFYSWNGIHVRHGTPESVLNLLQSELVKIINTPDFQKNLLASGFDPVGSSRADFAAFVKADIARWAQVIKDANVKVN
jgi:tripartite-type tricarboxylate transporter receptor subunit TctC